MPLNPGDLLFVGWDTDNEDVAFINTVDLVGGEVIYFTDEERDETGFISDEQLIEWTVPAGGVPIGTVVTLDIVKSPSGASISEGGAVDYIRGGGDLRQYNETFWAFQGTRSGDTVTPTNYIGVIANEADGTDLQTANLTGTGLTTTNGGAIIIDGDEDWMEYTADTTLTGPTITRGQLIASVTDLSNWSTADGGGVNNPNTGGVGFDVSIPAVVCFASGTPIDAPSGPRNVEDLAVGDFVQTVDNGAQQIRWIGRKTLGAGQLSGASHLMPVSVPKNALGEGIPSRDILLSPQHRILITDWAAYSQFGASEILIPAKSVFETAFAGEVRYVHILLDRHEILTSAGLKSESFHPGAQAIKALEDPARCELFEIFPELSSGDLSHRKFARPVATVRQAKELSFRA